MNLTINTGYFIESLKGKPIYEMNPVDARNFLENLQKEYSRDQQKETGVHEELFYLKNGIKVYVIKPKNFNENIPLILYIHGGGWVLGSKKCYENIIHNLVNNANCCVVFPEYSLSPEAKFPKALMEISYTLKHLSDFGIKYKNLIIAGDSAGGNMALTAAIEALKSDIPIQKLLLFYPVTSAFLNTESYEEFQNGPWLSKRAMEWFFDAYLSDKNQKNNPAVSPLLYSKEELALLPQTLVITAENDVLRNEGEEFSRKLMNANVKTTCVRVMGTCHDFMMLNALKNTEPAQCAMMLAYSQIENKT